MTLINLFPIPVYKFSLAGHETYKNKFIKPIVKVDSNNNPICNIKPDDAVICFNFRTDRCRQITQVLTQLDKVDLVQETNDTAENVINSINRSRARSIRNTRSRNISLEEIIVKEQIEEVQD